MSVLSLLKLLIFHRVSGLTHETFAALHSALAAIDLPSPLVATIHEYATTNDVEFDPAIRCPTVTTNHSLDANQLLGHWNVLGTRHPAMEELFDCPTMNITPSGVVDKRGHSTEHYEAYLGRVGIRFTGDEYAPDPAEPGKKLFSVFCAFGHCGWYIPYYWIETDAGYNYASVFYCWPALPWLVRGYLVVGRAAARPPPELEARFVAGATRQGLIPEGTELRWREDRPCWDGARYDIVA